MPVCSNLWIYRQFFFQYVTTFAQWQWQRIDRSNAMCSMHVWVRSHGQQHIIGSAAPVTVSAIPTTPASSIVSIASTIVAAPATSVVVVALAAPATASSTHHAHQLPTQKPLESASDPPGAPCAALISSLLVGLAGVHSNAIRCSCCPIRIPRRCNLCSRFAFEHARIPFRWGRCCGQCCRHLCRLLGIRGRCCHHYRYCTILSSD